MRVSVSDLDLYRSYRNDEDFPYEVFLAQLRRETPATPAMMRGRAFAKAMEKVGQGDSATISSDGHIFAFTCDVELEAWPRREFKGEKDYNGVTVSARCDRFRGRMIADDKTTGQFDAEDYIDKYQWRFYLDIFDADVFKWHVWECKEIKNEPGDLGIDDGFYHGPAIPDHAWCVYAHHLLTQHRYRGMEEDCAELVKDFANFARSIGYTGSRAA